MGDNMLNNKTIVALVPIKLNNERLKNKNIKILPNNKSMLDMILATLLKIKVLDRIIVYCSDLSLKQKLPKGVEFLQRNSLLDTNDTKMNDIIGSFIRVVSSDIYLLTHATAPLINQESIIDGLQKVASGKYDSSFSVKKIKSFVWFDFNQNFYNSFGVRYELNNNDLLLNYNPKNIPRTQDLQNIYEETSSFYIFEKSVFKNINARIGLKPYMREISKIESIDIDDKDDLFILESIISNFMQNS